MKNIKAQYVLANIKKGIIYLISKNSITISHESALTFDSKEDAVKFLDENFIAIKSIGLEFQWTTREFFIEKENVTNG